MPPRKRPRADAQPQSSPKGPTSSKQRQRSPLDATPSKRVKGEPEPVESAGDDDGPPPRGRQPQMRTRGSAQQTMGKPVKKERTRPASPEPLGEEEGHASPTASQLEKSIDVDDEYYADPGSEGEAVGADFVDDEAVEDPQVEGLDDDKEKEEDDGGPTEEPTGGLTDDIRKRIAAIAGVAATDLEVLNYLVDSVNATVKRAGAAVPAIQFTKQSTLGEDFGDYSKFDGSTNCLDHTLWAPQLVKMYSKMRPPPDIVNYAARRDDAELLAPSIRRWTRCPELLPTITELLQFACSGEYVNLGRMPHQNLRIFEASGPPYPMRHITRVDKTEPAMFISLVEVKHCSLLTPTKLQKRDLSGYVEKRQLIANLFEQEFEVMVCRLGAVYKAKKVTLPSWSPKEEMRGLSFQTRVSAVKEAAPVQSSPSKRRYFIPEPGKSAPGKAFNPTQIVGSARVPFFDASSGGLDLEEPLSELKKRPDMTEEAPPGSLGVVFYTISDQGDSSTIEFNVHAYAHLANEPTGLWMMETE